jgi:hypothetical protein
MQVHEKKVVNLPRAIWHSEDLIMSPIFAKPGVSDLTGNLTLLNEVLIFAQTGAQRRGQLIGMMLGFMVIAGIGFAILKLRKPPR